ncbi:chitooligosaccharide synthase NodC [Protofrankia symbiont of Coriaria ruscifolia]|uniref:chitooligosaccharide synthase NodC n=1 Tax=Protofrankia symbiont of Coriaria ruscifolia TaxID=1306542 RepID=UPI001040E287
MSILSTASMIIPSSYVTLALGYQGAKTFYARRAFRPTTMYHADPCDVLPSVDVIIPCYHEDPLTLAACLRSVAAQDYQGELRVYVVDDGSKNRDRLGPVYDTYAGDPRFTFLLLPHNVGKRKAQVAAIRRSAGDLVVNVDSDTIIEPDVVRKLAAKMTDPAVGAAMGQMVARNRRATWLTRLIDMEYWIACNEERAAQAEFGAVMCCCGPCTIYRRSVLLAVLDQYETQFFRGRPSDFGEDRHLTILMLKAGLRTEYVPDATAATVVPERMRPYLSQQLRWARSTYRDTLLAIRLLPRLGRYLMLDVVGQNLAPLLLGLTVLTGFAQIAATATIPWWPILVITAVTLISCCCAAWHTRQARFFAFALHTFINIFLLLPLKAYAICTLSNANWGSRAIPAAAPGGYEERVPTAALPTQPGTAPAPDSTPATSPQPR